MSGGVVVGLALAACCALGTNLGWMIKHRGAQRSRRMNHRHPLRSIRWLLRSRLFVAGVVIAALAGLLHVAALAFAPISTVQAVMAGGVLTLAVLAEVVFRLHVPLRQWLGVLLAAVGLLLLVLTLPPIHRAHSAFALAPMVTFEVCVALGGGLLPLLVHMGRFRGHDGALIGVASGAFFGVSDLATKGLLGILHAGVLAALTSPWLAVVIGTGAAAQYLSARSLQSGDAVSVGAVTGLAVNIVNITGGIVIFGDPLAHGTFGTLLEVGAFVLLVLAALVTPIRAGASRPTAMAAVG